MPYAIVVLLILIGDQAVKFWTSKTLPLNGAPRDFIPGVIQVTNIHNSGAAFGMLRDAGARWFFIALAIIFVALVVWLLKANVIKGRFGRWTLVMVMAGGVGNCLDRIVSGYVVDMFSFAFWKDFPVFNVADIFISVCGVLFCIYLLKNRDDLNDKTISEAVDSVPRPVRSRRNENDVIPERGVDYISQLSRPVVEGRKNIAAEKLAREIEKSEPEVTLGPGDWVAPPEGTKTSHLEQPAKPREHVNPFKELNGKKDSDEPVKADWSNPFSDRPAPADAPAPAAPEAPAPAAQAETPAPETPDDLFSGVKPAAPKKDEGEFSVDDIIAEFKDK